MSTYFNAYALYKTYTKLTSTTLIDEVSLDASYLNICCQRNSLMGFSLYVTESRNLFYLSHKFCLP